MEILPQHAAAGQGGLAVPPPELSIPRRRAEAAEATARALQERGRQQGKRHLHGTRGRPHMECPQYRWNLPLNFFFFCGTSMPICLLLILAETSSTMQ